MDIFNSIWRQRGRPFNEPDIQRPEELCYITQTDRDYSDLLERGDVAIKFWLPELMDTILAESCGLIDTTHSDFMRQILFTYLYGRYDWLGMFERRAAFYQLNPVPMVFYQTDLVADKPEYEAVVPEPEIRKDMGKNVADLKVWIPRKMKEDIQALATKSGITFSEMIREIIISTLIGHTYLPARNELLQMKIEVENNADE